MHSCYRTLRIKYPMCSGNDGISPDCNKTMWKYKPRKHWLLQMSLSPCPYTQLSLSLFDKKAWGFCILCCLICTKGSSCLFSSMQHLWFKILLTTFRCSWAASYLSSQSEQTRKELWHWLGDPAAPFIPLINKYRGVGRKRTEVVCLYFIKADQYKHISFF